MNNITDYQLNKAAEQLDKLVAAAKAGSDPTKPYDDIEFKIEPLFETAEVTMTMSLIEDSRRVRQQAEAFVEQLLKRDEWANDGEEGRKKKKIRRRLQRSKLQEMKQAVDEQEKYYNNYFLYKN